MALLAGRGRFDARFSGAAVFFVAGWLGLAARRPPFAFAWNKILRRPPNASRTPATPSSCRRHRLPENFVMLPDGRSPMSSILNARRLRGMSSAPADLHLASLPSLSAARRAACYFRTLRSLFAFRFELDKRAEGRRKASRGRNRPVSAASQCSRRAFQPSASRRRLSARPLPPLHRPERNRIRSLRHRYVITTNGIPASSDTQLRPPSRYSSLASAFADFASIANSLHISQPSASASSAMSR